MRQRSSRTLQVLALLLTAVCVTTVRAAADGDPPTAEDTPSWIERETLTGNWFGLGDPLAEHGIMLSFGLTQVYQRNVHGGLSTHRRTGEYSGSYDLELDLDLEALAGLGGGSIYGSAEGSWRDGVDPVSVGTFSGAGVNADAGGKREIDVTQLYYEQALFDGALKIRLGKLGLTGGFECRGCPVTFDGNSFANDETNQFLNDALVNNPTIPFPENGLGAVVYLQPAAWWYVGAGVGDAQADVRETGFRTAFHDEDYFFYIFETGVAPEIPSGKGALPGAYRVGLWYDPQPKTSFTSGRTKRDDTGFYLSFDQVALRENDAEDDTQGLGIFWRYGLCSDRVNPAKSFFSGGARYQGLIPARDDDVLGIGVAHSRTSNGAGLTASSETAVEAYYNAQVAGWLNVTPSIQYVENPGGLRAVDDAVVLGLRMQMAF